MKVLPKPETLVLTEVLANYLLASLTEEEKVGITSRVDEFTGLTVLTLPPSFHWVPVSYTGYLKRLHLATVPNGGPRIQVTYNGANEIIEVHVLPKRPQP